MNPTVGMIVLYQVEPLPAARPSHIPDRGTDRAAIVTAVYRDDRGTTVVDLAVFEPDLPVSTVRGAVPGTTPGTFRLLG